MFLRLSPEEKVAGLGGLLIIAGLFMPWFSVYSKVLNPENQSMSSNGLSGDLGVLGFVSLIMVILALLVLVGDYLHLRLPRFGYTKEQMLFFLMGQNAFLILLSIAVYTKKSLGITDAGLRFGIYVALIGAVLGTFSIFSQMQKLKKAETREFFEHEDEIDAKSRKKLEDAVVERGLEEGIVEEKPSRHRKAAQVEEEVEEETELFEEKATKNVLEEPVEELEEELQIEEEPEQLAEEEEGLTDEIDQIAEDTEKPFEPEVEEVAGKEEFLKVEPEEEFEAVADPEMELEEEAPEPEVKEKKKKKGEEEEDEGTPMSMNFYEDQ